MMRRVSSNTKKILKASAQQSISYEWLDSSQSSIKLQNVLDLHEHATQQQGSQVASQQYLAAGSSLAWFTIRKASEGGWPGYLTE